MEQEELKVHKEILTKGDSKLERKTIFDRYDDTVDYLPVLEVWLDIAKVTNNNGYPNISVDITKFIENKFRKMLEVMQEDGNGLFEVKTIRGESESRLSINKDNYFRCDYLTENELIERIQLLITDLMKVQDIKKEDLIQILVEKLEKTKLIEVGMNFDVIDVPVSYLGVYGLEEIVEIIAEKLDDEELKIRFEQLDNKELLIALYEYTDCTFEELLDKVEKSA